MRTAVITALVDDEIGKNIRNQLREAGVDPSLIIWFNTKKDGSRFSTDQKGTLMNGINFTFAGKGVIPSDTMYYRAHTAARELSEGDVDWDKLFAQEGVRVFSTGGIYMLISPNSAGLAIQGARKANEYGTFVAADLYYRSKVEPDKNRAQLRFSDSAVPNALGVRRTPADATIAVSRGLVELLDEREVAGVLAHEISHVANEDTRLSTIVAAIVATVAWPVTAWLRLMRARRTAVRVFGLFVGVGVAQVVLATLAMLAVLLAQGPGAFDLGGILGDGAPPDTQAPASPYVPMPRWVIVGLYAWSLHATMAPFYILVVAPAIAFMVRRAVSRQREFLADADAVVLTRDPEGLALALTKIGAAHGTLRSAESIAHLFIAPPRPSDRWFDRLFPTQPAIESRIDVLARMGAGLDRAEVARALEAGQRHKQAQAAEKAGRAAKAPRGGRPRYPGIETVPAETADAGDANAASGTATAHRSTRQKCSSPKTGSKNFSSSMHMITSRGSLPLKILKRW